MPTAPSVALIADAHLSGPGGPAGPLVAQLRDLPGQGCSRLVLNFSRTEVVNSIGISILLGVIDSAENAGTEVVFSEVKEDTAELFETLGIARHVTIQS